MMDENKKNEEVIFNLTCDGCGYTGPSNEFAECEACKDHGFCPKCNESVCY